MSHTEAMPRDGNKIHIPLPEDEAIRLFGQVKPTAPARSEPNREEKQQRRRCGKAGRVDKNRQGDRNSNSPPPKSVNNKRNWSLDPVRKFSICAVFSDYPIRTFVLSRIFRLQPIQQVGGFNRAFTSCSSRSHVPGSLGRIEPRLLF
jgi:hypothetical protein